MKRSDKNCYIFATQLLRSVIYSKRHLRDLVPALPQLSISQILRSVIYSAKRSFIRFAWLGMCCWANPQSVVRKLDQEGYRILALATDVDAVIPKTQLHMLLLPTIGRRSNGPA